MKIDVKINGVQKNIEVKPEETLMRMLRRIGLKSVKCGCDEGNCGVCSVIVDNKIINTCMVPAAHVNGSEIITVEGLGTPSNPHPIQRAFVEAGAVQCGFCTPAFVLSTFALLKKYPDPTLEQIKQGLDGVICRCTGHIKIFDAVTLAARLMKEITCERS